MAKLAVVAASKAVAPPPSRRWETSGWMVPSARTRSRRHVPMQRDSFWLHPFRFFCAVVQTVSKYLCVPNGKNSGISAPHCNLPEQPRRRAIPIQDTVSETTSVHKLRGAAKFSAGDTSRSSAGCRSAGSVTAACVILGFFSAEPDQRPHRVTMHSPILAQSKGKTHDVKNRSPYRLHWQAEPPYRGRHLVVVLSTTVLRTHCCMHMHAVQSLHPTVPTSTLLARSSRVGHIKSYYSRHECDGSVLCGDRPVSPALAS